MKLIKYTEKLKSLKSNPDTERFKRNLEKVHEAQRLLLNSLYLLHMELDEFQKAPREHRDILPSHDRNELEHGYSENIMFAAEALSRGFRIRGIENHTADLVQPAQMLCAIFEAIRFKLRLRAESNLFAPYTDCFQILMEFDVIWTEFEAKICSFYFTRQNQPASFLEQTQIMQVRFYDCY